MWPFRKKPGRTRTPRYVHKAQNTPLLPSISKGKRQLYKILKALARSEAFYKEQIEDVAKAKEIHKNKDHQKFLIDYIRERRRVLDAIEACLMIALSDYGHVEISKPLRAYTERVLEDYLNG